MPIDLSPEVKNLASILIPEATKNRILARLEREASENILSSATSPGEMDRIRFSILRLFARHPKNENMAFTTATAAPRDLFVSASFAGSSTEHIEWYRQVTGLMYPPRKF